MSELSAAEKRPRGDKKPITAARKEQNRLAQRAYRERLKKSRPQAAARVGHPRPVRELRPRQEAASTSFEPELANEGTSKQESLVQSRPSTRIRLLADGNTAGSNLPTPFLIDDSLSCFIDIEDNAETIFDSHELLEASGTSADGLFFGPFTDSALDNTAHSLPLSLDTEGHSLTRSTPLNENAETNTEILPDPSGALLLADPLVNNFPVAQIKALSAWLRNSACLFSEINCYGVSPLYRPITPQDDPQVLLANARVPSLPPHLQPTLPQILYPHPPYLDALPFPALRARAIVMAALMPHAFDLDDLKKDIYFYGGLVCWGRDGGGGGGGGGGQPWDVRSWEVMPWFLTKWKMLVGGESGEIWAQSRLWQSLRESITVAR
ncbi:hypothetical protein BX600DRAFT_514608 [Xylariales sp. PMI_506]|nr:hypothetical protein BX600DRAFT_514608 [Xylariales sp. PMI_506]